MTRGCLGKKHLCNTLFACRESKQALLKLIMDNLFLWKPVSYWIQLDAKIQAEMPLVETLQMENVKLWNRLKQKESDTELVEKAIDCWIPPEYREAILKFARRNEIPVWN